MKPSVKYLAIYKNRCNYSVSELCVFFGVSRSGYYKWLSNKDKPSPDLELAKMIEECQNRVKQTYGYRRIKIWLLKKKGLHKNGKAILRVMQKYGLLSEIRRRKPYQKGIKWYRTYENLLNQDFEASKPNEKWVTDISYIHTRQGVMYLSVIQDLYDNSVVSWELSRGCDVSLVTRTIKKIGYKLRKGTVIHSDQGSQYGSHEYHALSEKYGFLPSMSRKATPLDNACAENFFSILKAECVNRHNIKGFSDAKTLISQYIYFYNHERIQLAFACSPMEMRRKAA